MTYEKAYDKAYDLYHTYITQHIQGFNFFLVISGLLINALIDILEKQYSVAILLLLCGFELLISSVFFLLDIRSTKYMKAAKSVLKQIENEMCSNGECKIAVISTNDLERKKLNAKFRMTYVFRFVYIAFFLASLCLIGLYTFF
jgi:hypothetical protein